VEAVNLQGPSYVSAFGGSLGLRAFKGGEGKLGIL